MRPAALSTALCRTGRLRPGRFHGLVWFGRSFLRFVPLFFFFFQAEDGIRDGHVTGVQTCALPISVQGGEKQRLERVPQLRRHGLAQRPALAQALGLAGAAELPAGSEREPQLAVEEEDQRARQLRSEERRVGKRYGPRGARERAKRT